MSDQYLTHVWQESGMGKAPYQFSGVVVDLGPGHEKHTTCHACGAAIRYEFWIEDSLGTSYRVGSECIHKSGDSYMTSQAAEAKKALIRERRIAQADARAKARLQAERDANGGMTNAERAKAEHEAALARRLELTRRHNQFIVDVVGSDVWGYDTLSKTPIYHASPRFVAVIRDIYARRLSGARRGSRKYNEAIEKFDANYDINEAEARQGS